jgi:hypothetical protein
MTGGRLTRVANLTGFTVHVRCESKGIVVPAHTKKLKVKFTQEQAMKVQKGSRSTALLFTHHIGKWDCT